MNHAIFYTKITGATVIDLFFAQKKNYIFVENGIFFYGTYENFYADR